MNVLIVFYNFSSIGNQISNIILPMYHKVQHFLLFAIVHTFGEFHYFFLKYISYHSVRYDCIIIINVGCASIVVNNSSFICFALSEKSVTVKKQTYWKQLQFGVIKICNHFLSVILFCHVVYSLNSFDLRLV